MKQKKNHTQPKLIIDTFKIMNRKGCENENNENEKVQILMTKHNPSAIT